jgi:YHS domain-containing protein
MIKLLLFVLVCFVIYALFTSLFRVPQKKRPLNRSASGEVMVQDPQCGTYLPVGDALKKTIHGQDHYFCSKECFDKFKATHKP